MGHSRTCRRRCDAAPAPAADVFILAGQSNMSGRGEVADLTAAERVGDPTIMVYSNDDRTHTALDPLDAANGQVDQVSADANAAVGPGLFFARAVRAARGRPVLLVPCAKGGTRIGQWARSAARDTLYGSCLARARAVGRVSGVLWYQGESDAEQPTSAKDWARSFASLRAGLRGDLGRPDLPFVAVGLASRPVPDPEATKYAGWDAVQAQQRSIAESCTAVVGAGAALLKPDGLHLTTGAQRVLGARLAAAMLDLLPRCGTDAG